jgi:hypothetical protein
MPLRESFQASAVTMFNIEFALQFLAGAALALFLTPAFRPLGLSEKTAHFCRLAACLLFGVGMAVSIGATVQWMVK